MLIDHSRLPAVLEKPHDPDDDLSRRALHIGVECRRRTQVTRLIGVTFLRTVSATSLPDPNHFRKCRQYSTSGHRLEAGPDTTDVEHSVRRSGSNTVLQCRELSHDGRTPSVVELPEVANRDRLQILIGGTLPHELEIALIGEVDVRQGREKVLQSTKYVQYMRPAIRRAYGRRGVALHFLKSSSHPVGSTADLVLPKGGDTLTKVRCRLIWRTPLGGG